MRRNIFYNTMYQIVNMMIPLILAPYLSRILGASGVGVNSYAKAIAGYFVLFAMQGLNQYGNRTIALSKESKEEVSKSFWEVYIVQAMTSIIVLIAYLFFIELYSGEYKVALKINIIYVISAAFDINWFYFGIGEFKLSAIRNIGVKCITTILIFAFVKSYTDIYIYIFILSTGILCSNLVLWLYLKKYIIRVKVSVKECSKHIKPNFVLFIAVLAISMYKLMDKVMLGSMSNVIQNGYYENMSNVITIPLSIITAVGTVMLPRVSQLVKDGEKEKVIQSNRDTIQVMLGLSIPFTVGICFIADSFVPLYFGQEFSECINVLKLLAITSPFITFGNVIRTQCVIPLKKDTIFVKATMIGAILNFGVNLILIPPFGAVGAAIGTIVAEIAVAMYQYYKIRYVIYEIPIVEDNYVFVVSSIIMAIILWCISQLSLNQNLIMFLQMIIGCFVYIGCIYIYFRHCKNDRAQYWRKKLGRASNDI